MSILSFRLLITKRIKAIFHIRDLSLFLRKKVQHLSRLVYRQTFNSDDIIDVLRRSGVKPGRPLVIHSALGNLYNYTGSADELIDKLIDFLGPEGTLCMPAYPVDKFNTNLIFDINATPSAAGYLTEVFRKRDGVLRSLNQLHSVCAFGKDAARIVSEHHKSVTCFDVHSPYYIIGQLGGYSCSIGLPKWFIGTGCHVCESLLFNKIPFFTKKFEIPLEFTYRLEDGQLIKHTMYAKSLTNFIRYHNTHFVDKYFDNDKFSRFRLSNIWINSFDMRYLYERMTLLAMEGKTIYKYPKFKSITE